MSENSWSHDFLQVSVEGLVNVGKSTYAHHVATRTHGGKLIVRNAEYDEIARRWDPKYPDGVSLLFYTDKNVREGMTDDEMENALEWFDVALEGDRSIYLRSARAKFR